MTYHYARANLLPKLTLKIGIIFLSCIPTFAQVRPRGLDAYKNWQVQPENITPLRIGDALPDALWHLPLAVVNHPQGKETVTLRDYKGKLILLDFWARGCGSCIAAFPKLDSLQQQFDDRVQVVLATRESSEVIKKYLNKRPLHGALFSITDASVLAHVFPYYTIPHYVWIGQDGKLLATTDAKQITAPHIEAALSGKTTQLVLKRDLDPNKLFFLTDKLDTKPRHYSLLLNGHYPGLASQIKERTENGVVIGRSYANYSLLDLYRKVAWPILEQAGATRRDQQPILQVANIQLWPTTASALEHDRASLYAFEFLVVLNDAAKLDSLALDALNRASGYYGRIVHAPEPHLLITDH